MTESLGHYGPDCPPATFVYQLYNVPWDIADANGDGFIDTAETREAARHVHGSTPFYQETMEPADIYSWTLNVDPGLKDQFTDQVTLNLEREIIKDFSASLTFISKHSASIFANIPINAQTGQEWEYDRVPFTTSSGQSVMLYSVKWEDYNGDIFWIFSNWKDKVVNMGAFDGKKPKRDYTGFQLVLNKRYSNRWQALASFLYSRSSGMAGRAIQQGVSVLSPLFSDNVWMSSLNDAINNMEGSLPFTPKYEFKVSGSYTLPKIELDLGARFRMHSGVPVWRIEGIPARTPWNNPPGGVIDFGAGRIVGQDPKKPNYLPTQTILDVRAEKLFKLGKSGSLGIILDILNVFNSNSPNSIYNLPEWGKVGSIVEPRTFRFSFQYQF